MSQPRSPVTSDRMGVSPDDVRSMCYPESIFIAAIQLPHGERSIVRLTDTVSAGVDDYFTASIKPPIQMKITTKGYDSAAWWKFKV